MDDSTQPTMEPVDPDQPVAQPQPTPSSTASPAWIPPGGTTYVAPAMPMPGSVVGAAVVLLVLGIIALLVAGLFLLSTSIYQQLPDSAFSGIDPSQVANLRSAGRAFVIGFGVIALLVAICHIAAGVGIFRRAGWARVLGMVMAGLGILFTALFGVVMLTVLIGGIPMTTVPNTQLSPEEIDRAARAGLVVFLVIVAVCLLAYLFSMVALIRNGRAFR